jgi:pimeloyl-ACP methyl ester carboxylesterase
MHPEYLTKISSMDLLSTISGSAQDFKLVIDYLPIYFPQFTRFHNIMLGISLGGHTAYRLAALSPSQIKGYAIVVGCPSLGSLLLNRLGIDATALGSTTAELGNVDYDRLEKVMDEEQKRRWPRSLSTLIREGDREVHDNFPADTPLLLCNGKQDPLVPSFYTVSWLESRRENVLAQGEEKKMKLFVQDNTGHSCTKEMVAMISAWIGSILEPLSTGNTLLRPESHL